LCRPKCKRHCSTSDARLAARPAFNARERRNHQARVQPSS
jgi:hypothetical protein